MKPAGFCLPETIPGVFPQLSAGSGLWRWQQRQGCFGAAAPEITLAGSIPCSGLTPEETAAENVTENTAEWRFHTGEGWMFPSSLLYLVLYGVMVVWNAEP